MSVYIGRELFFKARIAAIREDLLAFLRRKPADLLPFDAIVHVLQGYERVELPRARSIPVDRIIGSAGRYRDFTRSFSPRHSVDFERWVRLDVAMAGLSGLPPIEVFQIGSVYFVANGNHRVSVARSSGCTEMEAYVTVIRADVDFDPDDSLDEALLKAERAHFLAQTRLSERFDAVDIQFKKPGGYPLLLHDIESYGRLRRQDQAAAYGPPAQATLAMVAAEWYNAVYLPVTDAIRRHRLPRRLRRRTMAELYLLVSAFAAGRITAPADVPGAFPP